MAVCRSTSGEDLPCVIFLGDWNARHVDWCTKTNAHGKEVDLLFREEDVQMGNMSRATCYRPNGSSNVDVVACTHECISLVERVWVVLHTVHPLPHLTHVTHVTHVIRTRRL